MLISRRRAIPLLAAATLAPPALAAPETLGSPTGKVILTISGEIGEHNRDDKAVFDRAMLEALGSASIRTRTPWFDGPQLFEGVPMKTLMQALQAHGTTVIATALNDYVTQIPMSDFTRYPVLLALKRNGQYMPVSDKGPLFIIYPYDSDPALQSQTYYSRSAWQVAALRVA